MSGIFCLVWLVKCFGICKVICIIMFFVVFGMLVFSLVLWVIFVLLFVFGLVIFGVSFGFVEVVINVEGVVIEWEMNKMVLLMMYGFYSFGILFGVGVGMVVIGFGLLVVLYILVVVLVVILFIVIVICVIFDGIGKNVVEVVYGEVKGLLVWCDVQLLLIGVIVLVMVFVEGLVNDWLLLLMVDGYGFSFIFGFLIYVGFIFGMMLGCFIGGWFIDCYSWVVVVCGSVVMGVFGIGLIIFVDNFWVVGILVLLWGIGVLFGFLLIIFVVSDIGLDVFKCVSVVVIIGYFVFFVGLLLLGFFGEYFGLCSVMMVVLGLVMVVVLVVCVVVKL